MTDIITQPIKFLGATVLSFNSQLGLGTSESTLNVDLIEDCESNPPDIFYPTLSSNNLNFIEVGAPVYFMTAIDGQGFNFGGVLTNWTVTQGGSGKTYNVKVVDPRQLLENTVVIIDTYMGPPVKSTNYFNVYAAYEQDVLQGNCNSFGASGSSERGMPYKKIIQSLANMNPEICSPTGYKFRVNFNSFPQNVPEFYNVPGPSITILQLLQDVCDVLGYEFYANLIPGNIIDIGLIDLKKTPSSFYNILSIYNGIATDLSYGQELRNEKTKAIIFGEKVHYMTYINKFEYFFGEDSVGEELLPVVPFGNNKSGFWINKRIDKLNASLFKPLPSNGPYTISELDIRSAMASYELWTIRALDPKSDGTLNKDIRDNYVECNIQLQEALKNVMENNPNLDPVSKYKAIVDRYMTPMPGGAEMAKPAVLMDLEAIHRFLQELGNTYYGKQWICPLKQTVCYHQGENFQEKIYTDIPTGEGGWVDGDIPVLGLSEPELSFFRSDDYRLNSFAVFKVSEADPADKEDDMGKPDDTTTQTNLAEGDNSPGRTWDEDLS